MPINRQEIIDELLGLGGEMLCELGLRTDEALTEREEAWLVKRVESIGERALCEQQGDDFYSAGHPSSYTKKVCNSCVARPECFVDSLTSADKHGPRAGLPTTNRTMLRLSLGEIRRGSQTQKSPVQVVN